MWVKRSYKQGVNMNDALNYRIVGITSGDCERVIKFMQQFFFRDEPLCESLPLLEGPEDRCQELEAYTTNSIHDGLSLMAVDANGRILGVFINGKLTREEDGKGEKKNYSNTKLEKIMQLLSIIYQESNDFKTFLEVDKILEIRLSSVDENFRRQGIFKALTEETKSLARKLGYPLVRVDCTSHYSAKAVAKLGFHCVSTLQYKDYLDSKGQPVFQPKPPHTYVKAFVLPIAIDCL